MAISLTPSDIKALPEFVSVDVPVIVKDKDVAYSLLGGVETLTHSIKHLEASVTLFLHKPQIPVDARARLEDDALSICDAVSAGGVVGTREPCFSLLLKVRRKKVRAPTDNNEKKRTCEASVVGKISHRYVFNDPADYQVK